MSNEICYCDLDGVFAPYPKCWLEFIEARTGKHFDSLEIAKKNLSYANYVSLKKEYRSSDFKYSFSPKKGSSDFTKFLHEEGYLIVIATTRPLSYPQLLIRTIRWLDKNNILFDDILFTDGALDVVSKYPDISFGVEDEPHVADIMAKWEYKMFLLCNGRNIDSHHRNVTVVDRFEDIIEAIKE
jgi:hypothetical protein